MGAVIDINTKQNRQNDLGIWKVTIADIEKFRELFCFRDDVYASQYYRSGDANRGESYGYYPVCTYGKPWECGRKSGNGCGISCQNFHPQPIDDGIIKQHLDGQATIGAYLVKENIVKNLIFDFDLKTNECLDSLHEGINRLVGALKTLGIPSYVEFSGNRGYHVWIFFTTAVNAEDARRLADIALREAQIFSKDIEIFPKQTQTESFGNLIKLPLGIHKKTDSRCYFLDKDYMPIDNQLGLLHQIKTVNEDTVIRILGQNPKMNENKTSHKLHSYSRDGLPCVRKIWEGVEDGHRDECAFFLARQLKRGGMPQELAENSLIDWDRLNLTPLGSKIISEKVESAYKNNYAALDCDNPHINQFCNLGECPVKSKKQPFEAMLEEVPTDTPKDQLFERLLPVLETMANQMDESIALIKLRHTVKSRFNLVERDLAPYEKKLRELCKQAALNKDTSPLMKSEELKESMSDEEKQEALDFLKRPDIDEIIIMDIAYVGYVGENANKFFQYCVATSRKLDSPLSTIIISPSAWGKSWLLIVTMWLMPLEGIEYYTRITKESLSYMKSKNLKHKWLVVMERKGSEEGDYNVRIMQSEKEIIVAVPVKNPVTGQTETEEIKIEGPIAYSESTTQTVLNAENETRVFDIYLDGSEEQTKQINRKQADDATLEGMLRQNSISKIIRKHQNAQRLLESVKVVIEYANLIKFPTANPTARRHFPKFLELIKVIAFLRQFQKETKETRIDNQIVKYIEADLRDYEIAFKYGQEILGATLDPLPKLSRDMLKSIRDGVKRVASDRGKNLCEVEFTRKEVAVWVGRDESYVRAHIAPLEKNEYLQIKEGGQGRVYKYFLSIEDEKIDKEYAKGITTPDELAKALINNSK
jgi:hypothetical protein